MKHGMIRLFAATAIVAAAAPTVQAVPKTPLRPLYASVNGESAQDPPLVDLAPGTDQAKRLAGVARSDGCPSPIRALVPGSLVQTAGVSATS